MSGVTVQTMIAFTSDASMPRFANAARAASTAISDVAISGAAMWRSEMPTRSMIQSLDVSTIFSRSAFVRTPGGTCTPSAVIFAPTKTVLLVAN